ncbi:MAG: hypothetical protein HXX08_22975 [Chloroflexi bacterium]|uniref:CARDB domain-containing protein n=1 Tax=Candidatus Chlorohelix allophototropha TaxID=3003348 RepID=A0A8T7M9Y3_9CHLR|nr:hypothetical protein [Chloroflexota bacterium]WJW68663.1 hypothetical protein OZ401_004279 [Chloroflexota bacterium L227-S17]
MLNQVRERKKRHITARGLAALAGIALLLGLITSSFAAYTPPDSTADKVWGQGGDFTTNTLNKGGTFDGLSGNLPTADSLALPNGVLVDRQGGFYVADRGNSRVLYYPAGSTTPTKVWGQGGDFTTNIANKGGVPANLPFLPRYPTADSLYSPYGIALDGQGGLYVADGGNSRVVYYPAGSTTATRVYGQGGDFTTATWNKGGAHGVRQDEVFPTADSLDMPFGVAVDGQGGLYVADPFNSRVVYYPAGSTTATRVYGQGGDFTTNIENKGGVATNLLIPPYYPTADSLYRPAEVLVDRQGGLYVADGGNNRVVYYPAGSTTATRVYGQGGDFTTNTLNKGGANDGQGGSLPTADNLGGPYGLAIDRQGGLYVADSGNHRVLYYPAGSTTATQVYGQGGDFTTATENKGGVATNLLIPLRYPTADSLYFPSGVAVDGQGGLYVADDNNNRVVKFAFPALYLEFTTQPSGAAPNSTFSTKSVVTAKDVNGNFVSSYNGAVTIAIKSGTGTPGAILGGTLTVNAVNGVATFTDLQIDKSGSGYVLTASATGLPSVDSTPFDVARPSEIVPQFRVSPDRVVATNPENLVSFSFKVKNIGAGNANKILVEMPIPQGLDVGYLDGASAGVWVTQVTATSVTIALPKLEQNQEASGTVVFRPNSNAVVGTEIETHYTLIYDDDTGSGMRVNSNSQGFVYGEAESNLDESKGAVQPGAAVSAKAGEKVSIVQKGYLANEWVSEWYTAPDGKSVSLGMQLANANGEVTIAVDTAGLAGDYAVVGYGNRSEVTQVNILSVVAAS